MLYVKALHIVSLIAWMAGLLYLPRLFVYHAECEPGSRQSETFKIMERRLHKTIMTPAMLLTYLFGTVLLFHLASETWSSLWIYIKLTAVAFLTILHLLFAVWRKAFENDHNLHSPRFFKIMNEIPAILMLIIVFAAVVKF